MEQALPDFEEQFGDERFSDVQVVICEEGTDLGEKRKREHSIPGHSMVLMGFSSYCKAKLTKWSARDDTVGTRSKEAGQTSSSQHTMELIVPAGQTEVAVRLVKGMYEKQPDLSDLGQDQQLQLLLLADRFDVPKLQAAAANALKSLSVNELQWDTAIAMLDLPDSCARQEDCKQLSEAAVRRLLQQLGDLEQVWADEQLQQLLTALPHSALLRLLQHDDTRVASEVTIVFTIDRWWWEQPDEPSQDAAPLNAALRQLMQQVRMQHLSPEFIICNLMRSDWVVPDCYTASELGIACLLASESSRSAVKAAAGSRDAPDELTVYPAWTAAERPTSAVPQEITWHLPLSDLRTLIDKYLQAREENSEDSTRKRKATANSEVKLLQGRMVCLRVEVASKPPPGTSAGAGIRAHNRAHPLSLGLYLCVKGLPPGSLYVVSCHLHFCVDASGAMGTASDITWHINNERAAVGKYWGCSDIACLGRINNAAAGEAALREQRLVHADGCLHMAATNIKLL